MQDELTEKEQFLRHRHLINDKVDQSCGFFWRPGRRSLMLEKLVLLVRVIGVVILITLRDMLVTLRALNFFINSDLSLIHISEPTRPY